MMTVNLALENRKSVLAVQASCDEEQIAKTRYFSPLFAYLQDAKNFDLYSLVRESSIKFINDHVQRPNFSIVGPNEQVLWLMSQIHFFDDADSIALSIFRYVYSSWLEIEPTFVQANLITDDDIEFLKSKIRSGELEDNILDVQAVCAGSGDPGSYIFIILLQFEEKYFTQHIHIFPEISENKVIFRVATNVKHNASIVIDFKISSPRNPTKSYLGLVIYANNEEDAKVLAKKKLNDKSVEFESCARVGNTRKFYCIVSVSTHCFWAQNLKDGEEKYFHFKDTNTDFVKTIMYLEGFYCASEIEKKKCTFNFTNDICEQQSDFNKLQDLVNALVKFLNTDGKLFYVCNNIAVTRTYSQWIEDLYSLLTSNERKETYQNKLKGLFEWNYSLKNMLV